MLDKSAIIVTYHKALSYGGCLQAYATLLLLEDEGFTARFLDYENPYEARKKSLLAVLRKGDMREALAAIVKDLFFRGGSYRRRAFDSFSRSLPLTPRSFETLDEAREVEADVFVVGSDQVWNPDITNGLERAFLLEFGRAERKVSIASSMGSHAPTDDELVLLSSSLSGFDAVSVREEFARNVLSPVVAGDIRVLLDPTLLVEPERWRSKATPVEEVEAGKYIFLFMVANEPSRYEGIVAQLKRDSGLSVLQVRLNSSRPSGVDASYPATPFEFIWLVDNAAFVMTDSFHGLAFALNLETPFAVLPNLGNNVRLEELLSFCSMSDRQLDGEGAARVDADSFPGFRLARARLADRRASDLRWVRRALHGEA